MVNKILSKVKTIVISAGHGFRDPGAVFGQYLEKDETEFIAKKVVENLKREKINAEYLDRDAIVKNPTNGNDVLIQKINHINKNYSANDWAIEIHRDSASGLSSEQANTQFGVYYFGGSKDSQKVAEDMVKTLKDNGAFRSTWTRPDTVARFGRLGWIRDTTPVAHLLECGFMQGEHTEERLNWYATLATEAIYKAFTGKDYTATPQVKPVELEVPVDSMPQYPREEVLTNAKFPNLKDYPGAYQNAIRGGDMVWVVNSLLDRDKEIGELKNTATVLNKLVSDLRVNGEKNLAEDQKIISELKTENARVVLMVGDLQDQLAVEVQNGKDSKNSDLVKIKSLEDEVSELQTLTKTKENTLIKFLDENFKNLVAAIKNNKKS